MNWRVSCDHCSYHTGEGGRMGEREGGGDRRWKEDGGGREGRER